MEFVNRVEAAEYYAELFQSARKESERAAISLMAELGRSDLFFLMTRLMGRKDMDTDWHLARCQSVQATSDGVLDLLAREHNRSNIVTFGLIIQKIVSNPEVTIGVYAYSRSIAKEFLAQIKHELERNELLKRCYPEVLWENPKRESPRWSLDDGIVVRRRKNLKEATVEAWGLVDGQPDKRHFEVLVYDVVVARDSVSACSFIVSKSGER